MKQLSVLAMSAHPAGQSVRSNQSLVANPVVETLKYTFNLTKLRIGSFLFNFWLNKRLKWGILLLLIAAPAAQYLYLIFPVQGFGDYFVNSVLVKIPNFIETNVSVEEGGTWFYMKMRFWVHATGEALSPVLAIFGIFLLFPKGYYPAYVTGIPFGYYLSICVHRMLANSYTEFHSAVGPGLISMLIVLSVIIFVLSDKMLFNQHHRQRAAEARIIGLINTPGIPWQEKEKLLKKEVKELIKDDNEIFTRAS